MPGTELPELIDKGFDAVEQGDTVIGLVFLEKAVKLYRSPIVCSYLAYCIAKERDQFDDAVSLCREAMGKEPVNSMHYLNLGRVYMVSGRKKEAIRMFRDGLLYENNQLIRKELDKLGWRDLPVIPALGRGHFLNKYLGLMFRKLRLR